MAAVEPIALKSRAMREAPTTPESIIFQLAIPIQTSNAAPIRMAKVETSPIEPGIKPKKASR